VKNGDYWDKSRLPQVDKLILICIPETLSRTSAVLSGSADIIEAPAPDAVPAIKAAGLKLIDNVTPHVWNYHPSMLPGSPWTDLRVRKAANLAIDRNSVVELLGGLAKPAFVRLIPQAPGSASRASRSAMTSTRRAN